MQEPLLKTYYLFHLDLQAARSHSKLTNVSKLSRVEGSEARLQQVKSI